MNKSALEQILEKDIMKHSLNSPKLPRARAIRLLKAIFQKMIDAGLFEGDAEQLAIEAYEDRENNEQL